MTSKQGSAPGTGSIGIVVSSRESSWVSCQSIVRNLLKSYEALFGKENLKVFRFPENSRGFWPLAREIHAARPRRLVFLDHFPHPRMLLQTLADVYQSPLPELFFHIYGDFTLFPHDWIASEHLLKDQRCRFICASPRQAKLVSAFMKGAARPSICHFPTDVSVFNFSREMRRSARIQRGLKDSDLAIVYTGRITLQKNILSLIRFVFEYWNKTKAPLHLYLAGPFDDIGAPFFGLKFTQGSYFHLFNSMTSQYPSQFRKRIHYEGNLRAHELRELYCASDLYASLSLHHDEDYGMSPAEALCCGLPAVLTDWGGFTSFKRDENSCFLVPVRLGKSGPEMAATSLFPFIEKTRRRHDSDPRDQRSEFYQSQLSIDAAAGILRGIHQLPTPVFHGFSGLMRRYGKIFNDGQIYKPSYEHLNIYREIYGNYTKEQMDKRQSGKSGKKRRHAKSSRQTTTTSL